MPEQGEQMCIGGTPRVCISILYLKLFIYLQNHISTLLAADGAWVLGMSRTCQQEVTLPDARARMFHGDLPERRFDLPLKVESLPIHQAMEPLPREQGLNFGEHAFDRVERKGVAHVPNRRDVQLRVPFLDLFAAMHHQLVHEQRYRST